MVTLCISIFFLLFSANNILGKVDKEMKHTQGFCPFNYIQIGKNCYLLGKEKVSGDMAFAKCLYHGGYLANFETLEEAIIMKYHLNMMKPGMNLFVGGRNINRYVPNGDWRWIKHGTMTKMEYLDFDNGEPDGSNASPQDCMIFKTIRNTYAFHNVFCNNVAHAAGYICETDQRKFV